MKRIYAILTALALMALLPSCSASWRTAESSEITDPESVDSILQEHFPEIFRAKEMGVVHVDGIIRSVNRKGEIRYKVEYDYHPHHDDDCD